MIVTVQTVKSLKKSNSVVKWLTDRSAMACSNKNLKM